jgi:hypothetical protein
MWRKTRSSHVTTATLIITVSAAGAALAGTVTNTFAAQSGPSLQATVTPHRVTLNHPVVVTGTAPTSERGQRAVVETASTPGAAWRAVASGPIGSAGHFRLDARLRHSGYLRVVEGSAGGSATAVAAAASTATSPSTPEQVLVRGHFRVAHAGRNILGGGAVAVRGRLLPAQSGRSVRLQGRFGRRWHTLGSARTGARGRFKVRAAAPSSFARRLRVVFPGDAANTRTTQSAGRLTVYSPDMASWYNDGGNTACGYHAGLGVANRTLPCGTKVRFYHAGHAVTATVDDRGPYVGGRNWDLNQNTAAALGFAGVGSVWVAQ